MTRGKSGIPNVVRKGLKYWYQVKIPKDIRDTLGKSNWQLNLQTSDLKVAKKRTARAAQEAQQIFAKARELDPIATEAIQWRDGDVISAGEPDDDLKSILITDRAEEIEQTDGEIDAHRFARIAFGKNFDAHVDLWCREYPVIARSENARRQAIRRFLEFSSSLTLDSIDRQLVGRYTSHLLDTGLDPSSINKYLQYLGNYYKFCLRKGFVSSDNPFSEQTIRKTNKAQRQEQLKRPWTDQEIIQLFTYKHSDKVLQDFIRIAALSGMRINEIAELQVKDCSGVFFKIAKSKTEASIRDVPIHSGLTELIQELAKGKAKNDYLFPELDSKSRNPARVRSMPVGKRFTRFHMKLFGDQRQGQRQSPKDFHSIRRWFITKCEEAGQQENVIAAVVGHTRPGMTFGVYSGGPSADQKKACIEAVSLPKGKRESQRLNRDSP